MKRLSLCLLILSTVALTAVVGVADPLRAPEWVNFSGHASFNGSFTPVGSIVEAFDSTGVMCGTFTVGTIVDSVGIYGFMPVYRDDIDTPADEGPEPGEDVFFKVNGRDATATGSVIWTSHGDDFTVDLDATGTVGIAAVELPGNKAGTPDDTIRFEIGVENTGDGLDFYGVSATSAQTDFVTLLAPADQFTYSDAGETVYLYFDIVVPAWTTQIDDTVDLVSWEVYSLLDPTQLLSGSVTLFMSTTDIGDDIEYLLPNRVSLAQNYPNPFNPATTIEFDLPSRANVGLEIINILGQSVDLVDMGVLPAGTHKLDYDAGHLSSGVYFYRIIGDQISQAKKMILLK